jgi:hypothetical protein
MKGCFIVFGRLRHPSAGYCRVVSLHLSKCKPELNVMLVQLLLSLHMYAHSISSPINFLLNESVLV